MSRQTADNGGVHTNSGIPSRAFVLAAKAIGGNSWEKAGKIWYVTLTERLTGNADFAKCAAETVSVARDLFPEDSSIAAKVAKAWADVGVLEEAPSTALLANIAGAYVIAPRVREMAVAPPLPKTKKKKPAAPRAAAKAARGHTARRKPRASGPRAMKIIVERSGGFAGIIRRGEKELSALSPEQQAALQKLLDAGAPPAATQMGADRFTYKIEVQDEHGTRSIIVPEALMPASLAGIATGP